MYMFKFPAGLPGIERANTFSRRAMELNDVVLACAKTLGYGYVGTRVLGTRHSYGSFVSRNSKPHHNNSMGDLLRVSQDK